MPSSWNLEFGGNDPTRLGPLLGEVVDAQMSRKMSDNQRAATAWYRANGDRERKHTVGVYLKRSRVRGAAPIMGVYVDSHAMATDLGVNKDLYLARLANVGYEVSGIEFRVSRTPKRPTPQGSGAAPAERTELPLLTAAERLRVQELAAQVPESLRPSVSKAIANSMRRQKLEKSLSEKTS